MIQEEMIFAATSDLAGKLRGKAFPAADLERRLRRGVGWTPTNALITCFDVIAESPYGALGDLLLIPDPAAEANVDFADGSPRERFMLGDIRELDGAPWECCTRALLRSAIERLERVSGLRAVAAFEHEFHLRGLERPTGDAYALGGYRAAAAFGQALMAALRQAGLEPDTFMKEYGPDQYEVTVGPRDALRAADEAAILRELTRATAVRHGLEASFTPLRREGGVGNGVHVHVSLVDADGEPATWAEDGPHGLSAAAGSFAAGILRHLPSLCALTAPASISYARLTPHRWSATWNNLGFRDREASLRICPVTAAEPASVARQFNLEYRVADAAASPHLALAGILLAGAQGLEEALPTPRPTEEDLFLLDPGQLAEGGVEVLPRSLDAALDRLASDETARCWFPGRFLDVYRAHKLAELAALEGRTGPETCAIYEATY